MSSLFKKTLFAAALLAAGMATAHAEGLYVGAAVSKPDFRDSIHGIGGGGGGESAGVQGALGYQFNSNFAIEGGLYTLGRTADNFGVAKGHGLYVDGVGTYELLPHWSVLGRLGLAEGRFDTTAGDGSSPALKVGAGVQYDVSRMLALRLEYQNFHFTKAFGDKPNVGEVVLGFKVGF